MQVSLAFSRVYFINWKHVVGLDLWNMKLFKTDAGYYSSKPEKELTKLSMNMSRIGFLTFRYAVIEQKILILVLF